MGNKRVTISSLCTVICFFPSSSVVMFAFWRVKKKKKKNVGEKSNQTYLCKSPHLELGEMQIFFSVIKILYSGSVLK